MSNRPIPDTTEDLLVRPTEEARASFGASFERIVGLMARLRGAGGCPWDQAQDLKTLRPYLIEEAYEVLEALEAGTIHDHREELGDLLLQVVFQAEIRRQEGAFDAADVAHAIADKLVRRHPHVFGDKQAAEAERARSEPKASEVMTAASPDQAYARWEEMKSKEKAGRSAIAGVPKRLPALLRAQRVGEKASSVGFDWGDADGPLAKLEEELGELRAAIASNDKSAVEHEIGDALFSLVNLARFFNIAAEDALRATVERFGERFRYIEEGLRKRGKTLRESTLEEMEALWKEAKKKESTVDS